MAVVEELTVLDKLDPDVVVAVIQQALMFLSNTSAHFNLERRSNALSQLNPDLKLLVEVKDFSQVTSYLFGPFIERKAMLDAVYGKRP